MRAPLARASASRTGADSDDVDDRELAAAVVQQVGVVVFEAGNGGYFEHLANPSTVLPRYGQRQITISRILGASDT